jgi:hypothetical protein
MKSFRQKDEANGPSTAAAATAVEASIASGRQRAGPGAVQGASPPSGIPGLLKRIDAAVPAGLAVYLIVDNYDIHENSKVRAWLVARARFQVHYTSPAARSVVAPSPAPRT